MAHPVHQLHLDSDDCPVLKVSEFRSTARAQTMFCVDIAIDYAVHLSVFCRSAEQVRAFVPSFVSKAEQAAMDAEDAFLAEAVTA